MKKIFLLVVALFISSHADAAIAKVGNTVRVTSMSFVAHGATAGNTAIVTVRINGGNVTGITGAGVNWTLVVKSSANRTAEIWCGANSTGPVTSSIVVVSTNAGAAPEITYSEWSGMGDTCAVEVIARNSGTSTTPTMGPIGVLHPGALVIAKTSWAGNAATVTGVTANGFTDLGVGDAGLLGRQGYKILTAADAALSTQATIASSQVWDGVIAAFVPKEGIGISR